MANRLTLMDGDLVEYQPTSVRTRLGRFPVRTSLSKKLPKAEQQHATPVPTSASHIDESAKPKYATPIHISADDERARPKLPRKEKFLKCLTDQSDGSYYDFMPLDQAGPAVIACDNKDRSFVAIKRAKKSSIDDVFRIPDFVSDHVVNIKDMFLDKEEVVIVYEQMDVSLRHIMAVAGGPLQAFEIAAVCKELVEGLTYIHGQLSMYHGSLSCATVLLRQDGKIKIANIADSILEKRVISPAMADIDTKCIGTIMMELMEPATSILDPKTTTLRVPEKWSDGLGIKDFLAATQRRPLSVLKAHLFLPSEPQGAWLERHVFAAVRAARVPWERPSLG